MDKKSGWKVWSKLASYSNFPKYFYIKTLIDYDYNMKSWNHIHTHQNFINLKVQ
jgi:hypothetical protein